MEDNNRPLGAPSEIHADEQLNAAPVKRKLNWRAFFLAVIAVIVIEILAQSMLRMEDPKILPPNQPTKAQPSPTIKVPLSPSIAPKLSCRPRPACLNTKPRCMIAETSDMCPN